MPLVVRRWKRRVARGGVAVVLLAAVVAASYAVRSAQHDRRLRAAIAAADAGGPWRIADLESARRPVAADVNVAPVLAAMAARLTAYPPTTAFDRRGFTLPPNQPFDAELDGELVAWVEAVGDAWADWTRLLARPAGRFPTLWTPQGDDILVGDQAGDVGRVARAGQWLAVFFAEADRPREACEAVRGELHAGAAHGDEPWGALRRLRCAATAAVVAERVLGRCEPTEADLAPLAAALDAAADPAAWRRTLLADRAFSDLWLGTPSSPVNGPAFDPRRSIFTGRWPRLYNAALSYIPRDARPLRAEVLELLTDAIAHADDPLHEQAGRVRAFAARAEAAAAEADYADGFGSRTAQGFDVYRRWLALADCGRVAVACERYRLRTGAYPATLADVPADLLAAVPTSPYTGDPLRYERTADGATVSDPAAPPASPSVPGAMVNGPARCRLFLPPHRRQSPPR